MGAAIKRLLLIIFMLLLLVPTVYGAELWYENFNDTADFQPPAGAPPWTEDGEFFTMNNTLKDAGGGHSGQTWSGWHVDRNMGTCDGGGENCAFLVHSTAQECTPILVFFDGQESAVRWKFDLYYDSDSGFSGLKFFHFHSLNYSWNCIQMHSFGTNGWNYTDLDTGARLGQATGLSVPNMYFAMENGSTYSIQGYTNLIDYQDQWITVMIEVNQTGTNYVKIWIDTGSGLELDMYYINDNLFDGSTVNIAVPNLNISSGGDFKMAMDNAYAYDDLYDGETEIPRSPGIAIGPCQIY